MLDETMHAGSDGVICFCGSLIRYLASNKVSPDDVIVLEIGVNDLLVRYFVISMHHLLDLKAAPMSTLSRYSIAVAFLLSALRILHASVFDSKYSAEQ